MIWLLIGYMWLFTHRPFEVWPWLGELHIERVYMIFTICCWLLSGPRLPEWNRLHNYFSLFVLVIIFSWLISPYQAVGQETVENYLKYVVFYVILVTSVRNKQGLRTLLAGYVGVMTLVIGHNLYEYYCGRIGYAQGIERLLPVGRSFDTNDFAGLIVLELPFVWLLWGEWTAKWRRALLVGHLMLAGYCVTLTGSRMGFAGMIMACLMMCMISPKRWRLLAAFAAIGVAVWMVLPQDRKTRYTSLIDSSVGPENAIASAGNFRYVGFANSLPLLEKRPLFGFGPMASVGIRGKMPHNLYGQLLGELGLAGAVTFGLILLGVGANTLEARRIVRETNAIEVRYPWRVVQAMSACFLLLAIMGWGFNFLFWHVWLWFGGFQTAAICCLKQQAISAPPLEYIEPELQTTSPDTICI